MEVVLVSTWPPQKCGIASYTQNLARALHRLGDRVSILAERTPNGPQETQDGDIPVYRIWDRTAPPGAPTSIEAAWSSIQSSQVKPDIVHWQHEYGIFPRGLPIHLWKTDKNIDIPNLVTLHTVFPPPAGGALGRWPSIVHTHQCLGRVPGARVIPHGVEFLPEPRGGATPEYYLVPGFVSSPKGLEEVLEGYALSRASRPLLIRGLCRDMKYASKLHRLIGFYGVGNRVQLDLEFDPHPISTLCKAHAVILGRASPRNNRPEPYSASGQIAAAIGACVPVLAKNAPIHMDGATALWSNPQELAYLFQALECQPKNFTVTNWKEHEHRRWSYVALQHHNVYKELQEAFA